MKGPQFSRFLWPVIDALKDLGGSGKPPEVKDIIVEKLNISEKEKAELNPRGAPRLYNQIAWAREYLKRGGYIDGSVRGIWSLTDKSLKTDKFSKKEAVQMVKQVMTEFRKTKRNKTTEEDPEPEDSSVPTEEDYRDKFRNVLLGLDPDGFERLCQRLLRESGFEKVAVTGKSGDGGIDGHGIIQVNPFVSFNVIFQCKRYSGSVTPSQVRDFRGAMMGRADKGIIITTGSFTNDAKKEAIRDGVPPIELVDGEKLIDMFIQLELGVRPIQTYEVDESFFKEFQS